MDNQKCTCGSGAHPRACELHPFSFESHCRWLDIVNAVEDGAEDSKEAQDILVKFEDAELKDHKQRINLKISESLDNLAVWLDNNLKHSAKRMNEANISNSNLFELKGEKRMTERVLEEIQHMKKALNLNDEN